MARSSRSGKLLKWGIGILLVLVVIYALGWFFIARTVKARMFALLEGTSQHDVIVACENLGYQGFPAEFGFYCDNVHVRDRATNTTFDTPKLLADAPVYAPWTVITTVEGPATLSGDSGAMLRTEWASLSGKMIYGKGAPRFLSFDMKEMIARFAGADGQQSTLTLEAAEGLARNNNGELDVALSANSAILRLRNDAEALDPVTFSLSATVTNGGDLMKGPIRRQNLRGKSGVLNKISIVLGDNQSEIAVSGPYTFDANGYLSGNFNFELTGIDLVARAIGAAVPQAADAVNSIAGIVSSLSSGQRSIKMSVKVSGGKAAMGFIPLGRIPPI